METITRVWWTRRRFHRTVYRPLATTRKDGLFILACMAVIGPCLAVVKLAEQVLRLSIKSTLATIPGEMGGWDVE